MGRPPVWSVHRVSNICPTNLPFDCDELLLFRSQHCLSTHTIGLVIHSQRPSAHYVFYPSIHLQHGDEEEALSIPLPGTAPLSSLKKSPNPSSAVFSPSSLPLTLICCPLPCSHNKLHWTHFSLANAHSPNIVFQCRVRHHLARMAHLRLPCPARKVARSGRTI